MPHDSGDPDEMRGGGAAPGKRDEPSFLRLVALSTVTVLVAGAALYGLSKVWGSPVLSAGYISLMFLAPAVRSLDLRAMLYATGWAMGICVVAVLVGTHGPWAELAGVAGTALGQGLFVVSGSAGLNRSPASFIGFSEFAETGHFAEVWQPLVGLAIGAVAVIVLGIVAFGSDKKRLTPAPLSERLYYGVGLAIGSVILTVVWQFAGWGGLGYALLVFCLIYAFDSGKVLHNSAIRVGGALLGVVSAVLVSLLHLPTPAVLVLFVAAGILALASMLNKQEFWYVVFLVAAVVHLAEVTPGKSALDSGVEHVLGVVLAAAVAVALHMVAVPLHNRVLKPAIENARS